MRFFFVHGGPGMHSFAERAMLGPLFAERGHEAYFWNEPSRLRPAGDPFDPAHALAGWVTSAERALLTFAEREAVCLIAHCWGSAPAVELTRRHPERIVALVLISPTTDHFAAFTRILRLAEQDLASEQPDVASALGASLARTQSLMDDAMRDALQHALHDRMLFTHYWADPAQFQASLAAWATPETQFDAESFFAVLADFARVSRAREPVSTPALLVYGGRDPIAPVADVAGGMLETLPSAKVEVFEDGGHFVHLDRPERFVDTVMEWAGRCVEEAPSKIQ